MYLEEQLAIRIDLTAYAKVSTILRRFFAFVYIDADQLKTDPKSVDEISHLALSMPQ